MLEKIKRLFNKPTREEIRLAIQKENQLNIQQMKFEDGEFGFSRYY